MHRLGGIMIAFDTIRLCAGKMMPYEETGDD